MQSPIQAAWDPCVAFERNEGLAIGHPLHGVRPSRGTEPAPLAEVQFRLGAPACARSIRPVVPCARHTRAALSGAARWQDLEDALDEQI